jgi:CRISPR-associated endonuclease/helicase Cas3
MHAEGAHWMSRAKNRAERLIEMERLYLLRAFTDAEMADQLGVDRTTAWKDRTALEADLPFIETEAGRWKIDRTKYLSNIRLSLDEALALYLAARRMSRQTRIAQPHVAHALEKLAVTLHQPMTERLVAAAGELQAQTTQQDRVAVIETIARAWADGIKLRVEYRALRARRPLTHVISPYLVEPSLWSDGAYVIGYSNVTNEVTSFKIERIEHAVLTTEHYTIPDTFDEQELLRFAWGIWYGEGEPMMVKLRFAAGDAARRVQESIWHPTQHIEPSEDGGCIWTAQVAEWQEMVPWVRGWGADVEVLEPKELRETLMGEAKAMAERYGWYVYSHSADQPGSTLDDFFGGR